MPWSGIFSKQEVETVLEWIERLKSLAQIALEMDHFKLSNAIREQVLRVESGHSRTADPDCSCTTNKQPHWRTTLRKLKNEKLVTSKLILRPLSYQAATQQAEKVS